MVWFPPRGLYDGASSPGWLRGLLSRKGYVDLTLGAGVFDCLRGRWVHGRCFLNPPWSDKAPFVERAVEESRSRYVVLLLPLDPTTSWFRVLLGAQPRIIIPMWRFGRARYPWMLVALKPLHERRGVEVYFVRCRGELGNLIP